MKQREMYTQPRRWIQGPLRYMVICIDSGMPLVGRGREYLAFDERDDAKRYLEARTYVGDFQIVEAMVMFTEIASVAELDARDGVE